MFTLRIEHPVLSYEGWKKVFDSDPVGRGKLGVRQYRVYRAVEDPRLVFVDLDFNTAGEARAMLAALKPLWSRVEGDLITGPTARIIEQSDRSATGPELRSIHDPEGAAHAADLLGRGRVVGSYIRGVCGLWADGSNDAAIDELGRVKGEDRAGRPLGTILDGPEFVALIDEASLEPSIRRLFLDPHRLTARLGSLCFIRVPVRRRAADALPARLVSRTGDGLAWLQNWIPGGCRAAERWIEAMSRRGIGLPAATSMNRSGEPELVDQGAGLEFSRAYGVPVFLCDLGAGRRVTGSFPIIQAGPAGISVLREGHFPAALFRLLLEGLPVDLAGCRPARHSPAPLPPAIAGGAMTGDRLRAALIDHLDG